MTNTPPTSTAPDHTSNASPSAAAGRVGCVVYLNSKPLIDGLAEAPPHPDVRFDVPSRLLADLLSGDVDLALCPVIDYFRSPEPLRLVPVGGICCRNATLTVRLFSQVPITEITTIHADTDSHTSVALLRILLTEVYGIRPKLVDYPATTIKAGASVSSPQAMLLIGDKVVTGAPTPEQYPYQLDLGRAWRKLTGLPFVFAVWMCKADASLGPLPRLLADRRIANRLRLDDIVAQHAPTCGWPIALARRYLGDWLHYDVGVDELHAIERFGELADRHGLIERVRPLNVLSS